MSYGADFANADPANAPLDGPLFIGADPFVWGAILLGLAAALLLGWYLGARSNHSRADAAQSIRRWSQRTAYGLKLRDVLDEISAPDDKRIVLRLKQILDGRQILHQVPQIQILPRISDDLSRRPVTLTIGLGQFRLKRSTRDRLNDQRATHKSPYFCNGRNRRVLSRQ